MLEILVERDGIVRTSIHAQLAEHTSSQVIFIFCQDFLLLTVLCLNRFAGHFDCIVRTSHLTQSAGYTAVFVILIVGHCQCTTEPVEHFQLFPVFRILFSHLLTEVYLDTGFHTRC